MADHGRDEIIGARVQREKLIEGMGTMAGAITRLMDDRLRHLEALRKIAVMTESGIAAQGGREIHRIAVEALEGTSG